MLEEIKMKTREIIIKTNLNKKLFPSNISKEKLKFLIIIKEIIKIVNINKDQERILNEKKEKSNSYLKNNK
jgi:hypothetical protein